MTSSRPSVLILEDERPQLLALRSALKNVGEIKDFSDPLSALRFISQNAVDVAIVDVHMPDYEMDGMGLITEIRKFDSNLSIVLRTGDDSTQLADEAIGARIFRRIIKGRTTTQELIEITQSAIVATQHQRRISLDASISEQAQTTLVETLGRIEDEHSVANAYRDILRGLKNNLTESLGRAEIICRLVEKADKSLVEAANANRKSLMRTISSLADFSKGPWTASFDTQEDQGRTTANGVLQALEARFASTPKWALACHHLKVSGLIQDMFTNIPAMKLLTALRHLTEFAFSRKNADSDIIISARWNVGGKATHSPAWIDHYDLGDVKGMRATPHQLFHISSARSEAPKLPLRHHFDTDPLHPESASLRVAALALKPYRCALHATQTESRLAFEVILPATS